MPVQGPLDRPKAGTLSAPLPGAVAQLVERLVRNEEVSGSIPLGSTRNLQTVNDAQKHPSAADQTGAVASPCIDVCVMSEAAGLCTGCLRTLDEIAGWAQASDDERRAILQRIAVRRATSKL
jgi:uncharacterized protein